MARLVNAFEQFFDGAGNPLVSGKLFFFESGSSTAKKDTFSDSDESTNKKNANPVILAGDGRAPNIFGTGSYRVILTDSDSVQIVARDPVGGTGGTTFGADWNTNSFYAIADVVRDNSLYWISLVGTNQGNQPSTDGGSNWRQWPDGQDMSAGSIAITKLTAATVNELKSGRKNLLASGDGIVVQRTIGTAINDDTYAFDRWIILSDGNGVATPTQETADVPAGARSAMKLTVAIANKKFGLLQIIEGKNCKNIISDVASLSAQAKASGIANLRVAVISWTGTEDVVTSDVVSAWNAAGTDPTLVANWTYENTPANLTLSGSWAATFKAENVSIDTASTKQVAVFIWIDDTDAAVSDTLFVTEVQIEKSSTSTDFEYQPVSEVEAQCQRYYFEPSSITVRGGFTSGASSLFHNEQLILPVTMRATPTASHTFSVQAGTWDTDTLTSSVDRMTATANITAESSTARCTFSSITLDSEL